MNDQTNEMMDIAKKIDKENNYLSAIKFSLSWDLYTELTSQKGIDFRNELIVYIDLLIYKNSVSDESAGVINYFKERHIENKTDSAIIRQIKNRYDLNKSISIEDNIRIKNLSLSAQRTWKKAYRENDYDIYKKDLKDLIEANIGVIKANKINISYLDWFIQRIEVDITTEEIDSLFYELKIGLIDLLKKINASSIYIDDSVLDKPLEKHKLKKICELIVQKMGYDLSRGAYAEALHPMSIPLGTDDVRILNKYENFKVSVFSILHEAGHSIYTQNTSKELHNTTLWTGHQGSIQEGQARFFENIIGRSREFWLYFYPMVQNEIDEFKNVTFDSFIKMINKVSYTPIRVDADEITYSLHIIIRYEIERDIFEGKITVEDIPKVWNSKYNEYLNIEPKSDREGVLQDPHWSLGFFGYFQSYAIGNLYAAQFFNKLKSDIPNVMDEISKGNFDLLNNWLRNNIYKDGNVELPSAILHRVTNQKLSAKYYLEYLNEKYSKLYNVY